MRILTKILIAAVGVAIPVSNISADVTTGNVDVQAFAAISFVEDTRVNFGQIPPSVGTTCVMNNAGAVTGPCTNVPAVAARGQITVSALISGANVFFTITGDNDNADIDFEADAEVDHDGGADAPIVALMNGIVSSPTTLGSTASVVTVYGTIDVATALTAGQAYSTTYTLDVTYQ